MVTISISGVPGTGKTVIAKLLAKELKWKYISLNKFVQEKNLYCGYDKLRKCKIVDIEKLRKEIKRIKGNVILESHYAEEIAGDFVIILRTNPKELRERLKRKDWSKEKIDENIEAEIMEVCKQDALELGKRIYEVDTTNRKPNKAISEILKIIEKEGLTITRDLRLPAQLKPLFREPYGKVFKNIREAKKELKGSIISVGDPITYDLINSGIKPIIAITDGREKRKPFKKIIKLPYPEIRVKNPPGQITLELWEVVKKVIGSKKRVKIFVDGEEDLAALPCIILAPDNYKILYGLWDRGIVIVKVNEEKRKKGKELLKRVIRNQ